MRNRSFGGRVAGSVKIKDMSSSKRSFSFRMGVTCIKGSVRVER
jgi:hypothetical protein